MLNRPLFSDSLTRSPAYSGSQTLENWGFTLWNSNIRPAECAGGSASVITITSEWLTSRGYQYPHGSTNGITGHNPVLIAALMLKRPAPIFS
jgi:hypothetical protein